MPDKKTITNQMLRPDWNADLPECRDQEKILVQMLRESNNTGAILEICDAIGPKGSLFVTLVLMAKMTTATDKMQQSYYGDACHYQVQNAGMAAKW